MSKRLVKRSLASIAVLTGVSIVVVTSLTLRDMRPMPSDLSKLTTASIKPQLLDRYDQPLTITYQNHWNAHDVTPLYRTPDFLQQAFILAEDKRFYQHSGIDWLARLNAVWQNSVALKGLRGASTISEQVVRMIHTRPRTIWAKWLEGWEARQLEANVDKASILEFYLNQVPYAAQRRGVQQAASYYFDRQVSTLNQKEMLALAVLVRAPSYFDLYKSTRRLESRLDTLLERAIDIGLVTDIEHVRNSILTLSKPEELLNVSHFARYIADHSDSNSDRSQQKIKTTLDSNFQRVAQRLLNQRLKTLSRRQVANAGMLVVDHQTDEVLVWAVGENKDQQDTGYDSLLVKRQPGSTLKPFVYAAAMEKGWTAATMIDDSPLSEAVGRGVHSYRNYSNTHYGQLSLRNALGNSLNIPAIRAAQFVGVEPLINTLDKLGIEDLDLRSVDYGNGIALGNAEINLVSLVTAYATLARQGVYRRLRVTNDQVEQASHSVFSPEVSSIIGNILSDPSARLLEFGSGGSLHMPIQTAVKTGTSNDYRDAWVVGYNHRYVVGIWMGNLDNQPMDRVTGSSGPALVLRSMFAEPNRNTEAHPLYLSRKLLRTTVCIDSGRPADQHCRTRDEWFRAGQRKAAEKKITSQLPATEKSYQLALPIDQMEVAMDPRIPDHMEAIEFKLNDHRGVYKVEWYINGLMVASTTSANYHWPVKTGKHKVRARVFSQLNNKPSNTADVFMVVK
jgi:penicillin-binding protein 1C